MTVHLLIPDLLSIVANSIDTSLWDTLARAGGGGSGGGGGGGGSGGSGNALAYSLVTYAPLRTIVGFLNKRVSHRMSVIVGSAITAGVLLSTVKYVPLGIVLVLVAGAAYGVYDGAFGVTARLLRKFVKAKQTVDFASRVDEAWDEAAINWRIGDVFARYQADWSACNLQNIQTYTSPRYYGHVRLLLTALRGMGRYNVVDNPVIIDSQLVEAVDRTDNDQDHFTVHIKARASDTLMDDAGVGRAIYTTDAPFEELWHFDRQGNEWMLDDITQLNESSGAIVSEMRRFAEGHGMHYSADMGWLLLPRTGELFKRGSFGRSNINNHIIGEWQGMLVQLYTYVPYQRYRSADTLVVAQVTLPEAYGNMLVRRHDGLSWYKRGLGTGMPSGYQQVKSPVPEVNEAYDIYMTDVDKASAMPLMRSRFLQWLSVHDSRLSMEVGGNAVFIYMKAAEAGTMRDYALMLEVLQRAYAEMVS